MRPIISLSINAVVPHLAADHTAFADLAADYEAWGADQIVIGEHLLMPPSMPHPGASDVDLMIAWPEPFVALAAVAARTTRVRLTTGGVLGATRSAVVVAKLAATLDAISGGRFSLGLVGGWLDAEFDAVGVPFAERFARTDELARVCRSLWGSQPASFHGRFTTFDDLLCLPVPAQGPALPIWFGGRASAATAQRIASLYDGWIVSEAADVEEIRRGVALLGAGVGVRATLPRTLRAGARTASLPRGEIVDAAWGALVERVDAGVTDICVPIHTYADRRDVAAAIVSDLMGRLADEYGPAPALASSSSGGNR